MVDQRNTMCKRLNFLITGAGRGIGRGLTRRLLAAGHRVFLLDSNTAELTNTITLLSRTHKAWRDFEYSIADVTNPVQITAAVARAQDLFGADGLHCLVNNAAYTGGVGGLRLEDMTLAEWERSLSVNLTGPMLMTQACLPLLERAGGCVIHMSSTRAAQSEAHNEAYSTTKAGLLGMAQSMAVSLAPRGIRVSAILPGWIHVENECKEADEEGRRWEDGLGAGDHRWHLTGRVGRVEDVVRAVVYLTENTGVTGAEMVVDGGVTRKMVYPE